MFSGLLPTPSRRFDLRIGDWGFHVNLATGKLEIYRAGRPELAHLTLAWGTSSGELDIHLTYGHERSTSEGHAADDYAPLLRIPLSVLRQHGERAGEAARDFFLGLWSTVWKRRRPGWLTKKGYVIGLMDRETLGAAVKVAVPKERSKYRVKLDRFEDPSWLVEALGPFSGVYDPEVLWDAEVRQLGLPVQAIRRVNGRPDLMMLFYGPGIDGRVGWWGARGSDVIRAMNKLMARFFDWLIPLIEPAHVEKFEQIVRALALDESPATSDFVNQFRLFLRQRRNPVRSPLPTPKRALSLESDSGGITGHGAPLP